MPNNSESDRKEMYFSAVLMYDNVLYHTLNRSIEREVMPPKEIAREYVRQHPEFCGLLLVHKLQPAGKGGWKTKRVTYEFVAVAGKYARRRSYSDQSPCGHYLNSGPCWACARIFLKPALRPTHLITRDGAPAFGGVCGDCLSAYQLPVVKLRLADITVELGADLTREEN
jgi:hypothetical protein